MKTIQDYIKCKEWNHRLIEGSEDDPIRCLDYILQESNIHEDEIDHNLIDIYYKWKWGNIIYNTKNFNKQISEMLKTHDTDKLIKKIAEVFPQIDINTYDEVDSPSEYKSFYLYKIPDIIIKRYDGDKKYIRRKIGSSLVSINKIFNDILNFYNYYITEFKYNKKDSHTIGISPLYPTNKSNYIYNNCKGIVYHVTESENVESILRTGLRPKGSTNIYRFFTDRVYVFGSKNFEESFNKVKKEFFPEGTELTVLKIDLSGHTMDFYQDDAIDNNNCFFTYHYIHHKNITVYKENIKI